MCFRGQSLKNNVKFVSNTGKIDEEVKKREGDEDEMDVWVCT